MTATASRWERPGAVWVAPAALLFCAFAVVPIAGVCVLSLTRWNGLATPQWTGLANWRAVADDPDVWPAIRTTLLLTVACWAVQTPLSLLLGVWAAGVQRTRAVLSAVFFLPMLLSTAAIALTWLDLLDPNFGIAPTIGPYLGATGGNVLGDPDIAIYVVVFVISWQFVPFHTLIYQSAARQIPESLFEAASLDGAGRLRQFVSITVPQLRNSIVASSVLMIVGSLTYFESILLLTGGGPGTATRVLPLHMYIKGFVGFDMGYASALAVLLVVGGSAVSLAIVRITGYQRMSSQREGA